MTIKPKYHEDKDDLEPVVLEPFKNFNWKTEDARDSWKDAMQKVREAKDEAEWRSVMDSRTGRKVAIIHVNNYNREEWLRRVGEHGLFYRDIRYSEPYNGFSHKHFPTDIHNMNRITYAVISQDEDVAEEVKEAEMSNDREHLHDVVGKNLGFPDCCREHFLENWNPETGDIDPMYEISCNSGNAKAMDGDREKILIENPNPGANIMWRYFGYSFITHIPCSWDCEESIDIARERYRIMSENGYGDAADALTAWLSEPHTWDGLHGIARVRNRYGVGSAGTSSYWNKKTIVWGEEHDAGGSII